MKNLIGILLLLVSLTTYADQQLQDQHGHTFGYIRALPDGRQVIQDQYGKTYGSFSPKAGPHGQTYDIYGRMIGTGNQLIILLPPEKK